MEQRNIGGLIRKLRIEKGLTQLQLANVLCVSDKTVSKWECLGGSPDISLFPKLTEVLGINTETLVNGGCDEEEFVNGSMKKIKFYVCPECKNVVFQIGRASIGCCGKKMEEAEPQKAAGEAAIKTERMGNELFVSLKHEMTKKHYIAFIAFVTGDTAVIKKLYPEWNLETHMPFFPHGTLYWYCTKHGLFYMNI